MSLNNKHIKMHERHSLCQEICALFCLFQSPLLLLCDRVYSPTHSLQTTPITSNRHHSPSLQHLTLFSKYQEYWPSPSLSIDALWILEGVLISTRGDICCVFSQVIALITWLVLHTWTESDVKLSSNELTCCFSSRVNTGLTKQAGPMQKSHL